MAGKKSVKEESPFSFTLCHQEQQPFLFSLLYYFLTIANTQSPILIRHDHSRALCVSLTTMQFHCRQNHFSNSHCSFQLKLNPFSSFFLTTSLAVLKKSVKKVVDEYCQLVVAKKSSLLMWKTTEQLSTTERKSQTVIANSSSPPFLEG